MLNTRKHALKLSGAGLKISEWRWKGNFDFTEIANNGGLKQGQIVCQIQYAKQYAK